MLETGRDGGALVEDGWSGGLEVLEVVEVVGGVEGSGGG